MLSSMPSMGSKNSIHVACEVYPNSLYLLVLFLLYQFHNCVEEKTKGHFDFSSFFYNIILIGSDEVGISTSKPYLH